MVNELVLINGKVLYTTSKKIADGCKVEHDSVAILVKKYKTDLNDMGFADFKSVKFKTAGRPGIEFILDEEQSTFLITLMKNSRIVVDFKKKLVKEFYKQRSFIINTEAMKKNASWIEERKKGKVSRKDTTDTIKSFIEYAVKNGSKNGERYYGNYTRMQNAALFILQQKYKNIRDVLDGQQLSVLNTCDQIVSKAIRDGMKEGLFYKDIFQRAKKDVLLFVELIGTSIVPTQKLLSGDK
jgi:phage regulator Rha-like protein